MRALLIDDSKPVRSVLSRMFSELGFEVAQAENGRHALELLERTETPEVALVEWNMPEMNGLEFVQAVRADARHERLRVMMVTSETNGTRVAQALEAGANEYVMKPFTKEMILEKLQLLGLEVDAP